MQLQHLHFEFAFVSSILVLKTVTKVTVNILPFLTTLTHYLFSVCCLVFVTFVRKGRDFKTCLLQIQHFHFE
jgi:hypothetical protein